MNESHGIADVHAPRTVESQAVLARGIVVDFVEDRVVLDEGAEPVRRQYTRHPGAVGVVALRGGAGAEQVLLLRQYRHPVRSELWEIPAGLLDVEGEAPVLAAQRELAEEADLVAGEWHSLVDYFTSPGGSTEPIRIFVARDLAPTASPFPRTDEEAGMEAVWVDLDEAARAVLDGRIHNPNSVAGILAAHAARAGNWAALRPADSPWFR